MSAPRRRSRPPKRNHSARTLLWLFGFLGLAVLAGWAFGGDMIDRETYLTAEGVLNGPEAVAFGEWFQSLFERGLLPGPSQTQAEGTAGFINGDYAIQWNGNWRGVPTIEAFQENGEPVEDLLFLPAPDFGNGPIIGAGSWQWGITPDCEFPEALVQVNLSAAVDVIEQRLGPEHFHLAAHGPSPGLPGQQRGRGAAVTPAPGPAEHSSSAQAQSRNEGGDTTRSAPDGRRPHHVRVSEWPTVPGPWRHPSPRRQARRLPIR